MIKTPNSINENVVHLVNKLFSNGSPLFIQIKPAPNSLINNCFENVEKHIRKEGGERVLGWQIWEHPFMVEAEFHAVWKSPSGELIDITPKSINEKHILFVIDAKAEYAGQQTDNLRLNTVNNGLVDDFIELAKTKYRIFNKGDRANQNGQVVLSVQEAKFLEYLNLLMLKINTMLMQGKSRNSLCFCNSTLKYKYCHGRDLIKILKTI